MDPDRETGIRFLLSDVNKITVDVLPSHCDRIGATLTGEEHQSQRQTRLRPDRMPILELLNFVFSPGMKTVARNPEPTDPNRRVILSQPDI